MLAIEHDACFGDAAALSHEIGNGYVHVLEPTRGSTHNYLERFVFAACSPKGHFTLAAGSFVACNSSERRNGPNHRA